MRATKMLASDCARPSVVRRLVVEYLETIPESGTCLKIDDYPIEIVESNENRISKVRIHAPLS